RSYCLSLPVSILFLHSAPPLTQFHALPLHDALPIFSVKQGRGLFARRSAVHAVDNVSVRLDGGKVTALEPHRHVVNRVHRRPARDRKSTRLNSSHVEISYAVFCLKKKKICIKPCIVE